MPTRRPSARVKRGDNTPWVRSSGPSSFTSSTTNTFPSHRRHFIVRLDGLVAVLEIFACEIASHASAPAQQQPTAHVAPEPARQRIFFACSRLSAPNEVSASAIRVVTAMALQVCSKAAKRHDQRPTGSPAAWRRARPDAIRRRPAPNDRSRLARRACDCDFRSI